MPNTAAKEERPPAERQSGKRGERGAAVCGGGAYILSSRAAPSSVAPSCTQVTVRGGAPPTARMAHSPALGGSPNSSVSSSSASSTGSSFGGRGPRWLQRCLPLLAEDVCLSDLDPVQHAAFRGDSAAVDALIRGGAPINGRTRGPQKLSCLHLAAMGGHAEIVETLLEAGAAPVCRDGKGRMASFWAHKAGHTELASRLEPKNWMTPRAVGSGPPWRV